MDGKDGKPGSIDADAVARNLGRVIEEASRALYAYLKGREEGELRDELAGNLAEAAKTLGQVAEYWLADPKRTLDAQTRLMRAYFDIWAGTLKRLGGEPAEPVARPAPKDQRFADAAWSESPFFDALKQAYLVTADWGLSLVREAQGIDDHTRHKADFYVRQIASAISPSNFVLTNPELLRETFASSAENLARGLKMLAEDIEAGGGELRIRQTDASRFEVGGNLATTPGKVVFENDLIQLIQYAPTTPDVLALPVVVVPPWINKYYVLDLTPEKSFLKWAVDRGLTVFVISWVNPDARLAGRGFDDYMREGVIAALDAARAATGERKAHAVGYCVGGTMLAATLAWLAARGEDRVASASFLATQVDFTHAGDLKVFVDEAQLQALERHMGELGYLEASRMAAAFNMLRANDLIWPYIVNNYMRGKPAAPFDLLYWNSDSTRLAAAIHSFYLRNCYLENKLARGEMELAGTRIDLKRVTVPVYNLAAREDHIAPARSVFLGSKSFGGPVRFVLAGSGHIAGIVNPPDRGKYPYWTGPAPVGEFDAWIAGAEEHPGSWWPDWYAWIEEHDPRRVAARKPGDGKLRPIEDAPGRYVKVKA